MGNNRTPEERDRRRKARAAKSQAIKPEKHEHSHPGGTAAAIGTHLAKFSSFQGISLLSAWMPSRLSPARSSSRVPPGGSHPSR